MANYSGAIESYRKLLQQAPESEFASAGLNNMALSHKKMQNLTEAADSYMKLALNYPQDPYATDAMFEAAKIKKELKQFSESLLVLRDVEAKFAADDERKLETLTLIGECYISLNDSEEAVKSFKALYAGSPQGSNWKLEALRQLGALYEKQEKWGEAVSAYEEGGRTSKNSQVAASFRERAKYLKEAFPANPEKQPKTTGQGQ